MIDAVDRIAARTGYTLDVQGLLVTSRVHVWPLEDDPNVALVVLTIAGMPQATWLAPFIPAPRLRWLTEPQRRQLWHHYRACRDRSLR